MSVTPKTEMRASGGLFGPFLNAISWANNMDLMKGYTLYSNIKSHCLILADGM